MPLSDRDYIRGKHPPNCTCKECTERRLGKLESQSSNKSRRETPRRTKPTSLHPTIPPVFQTIVRKPFHRIWINIPLSVHKLFLSLLIITGLVDIIRRGYILFTYQTDPIKNTIIFLVEVGLWFWIIAILRSRRYKYRKPKFKLVFITVIAITLVCAFAGVPPMSTYKDNLIESWKTTQAEWEEEREQAEAEREKESPEPYGVLQFNTFTDKSTGFSVEYPESWTFSIIDMNDEEVTRVSFEGTISQDSGILCSLLIGYNPTLADARGLWTSMVNLAGASLTDKKSSTTIGGVQGHELAQEINGENSRIFVSDWKSGLLLATRSYPIDTLTPSEINKLNNYLEHLVVTASIIESNPKLKLPPKPETTSPKISVEDAEREAFKLINQIRGGEGLQPTRWDDELYKLSKAHTQKMADKGELFHTPLGASYGENAWGGFGYHRYSSEELAKVIVNSWMSSPLHKAWILNKSFGTSVVSIVVTPTGQYASWTFWAREIGEGPPLVRKISDEWQRETGGKVPWIEWLYMKGYLD